MIEIDGSDGGGQLVRSSVALSALTGDTIRIEGIRGERPDPGLKHQHCTAVDVAAEVVNADVEGAEIGSDSLTFDPGSVEGGRVEADVGTAGSVTLVFDTVLPLATALDAHLAVTVRGGTDVKWSPPMDYYRRVKLPLLREHGWAAAVDVRRRGFYPAGGGEATLHLWPSDPNAIDLVSSGSVDRVTLYSIETTHLADSDVACRQAAAAADALADDGVEVDERSVATVEAASPGSAIVIGAACDGGVAGASALGEPGTPAEAVGESAAEDFLAVRRGSGAVDEHLADQLLLPSSLVGGAVAISEVTDHVRSSLDLLERFSVGSSLSLHDDHAVVEITETR